MTTRDEALELIGSMGSTAEWLNRLDRLFSNVRDSADALPAGSARDYVLASIEAFRREFYGADDGSDHPEALDVSGTPLEDDARVDVVAKAEGLEAVSVTGIPDNTVLLVVGFPMDQFDAAKYDRVHALAKQLAATFPDPQPHILLNPNNVYALEGLDIEAMAKIGWYRR